MMDAKILVIFGILLATAASQTSPETPTSETPFVAGVFIPADALKSLQEKAKEADVKVDDAITEPSNVAKNSDQISPDVPDQSNQGYQQMPDQQQVNPLAVNQQGFLPEQQRYGNQQMLNQPAYNQQGMLLNQQPGYNQQTGYNQQPGFNQQMGYQQPGYFQNGMGNQPYISNPQAILVGQQTGYPNAQGVLYQQPYQQPMLVGQQPNQQLFIPNGQIGQQNLVGQPGILANNPGNGAVMGNPGQNTGNMYTLVPVNGQNAVPNPNLGNNNGYFVPVQQMPTNGVLLNNGK